MMAGIFYRCVFCGSSHEVARRAGGPLYLRCPATYRWAWYDAAAFQSEAAEPRRAGRAAVGTRARASARRRTGSARAAAAPRRAGRKTISRAGSGRTRSRKGGRR
jgi:hypothetical protein